MIQPQSSDFNGTLEKLTAWIFRWKPEPSMSWRLSPDMTNGCKVCFSKSSIDIPKSIPVHWARSCGLDGKKAHSMHFRWKTEPLMVYPRCDQRLQLIFLESPTDISKKHTRTLATAMRAPFEKQEWALVRSIKPT
jgi:hypothetical protein